MIVSLTEKAAEEVKKARDTAKIEADAFLRVSVEGGGCSGFGYRLHFDKSFDESMDDKIESHGVSIVVDKRSALLLNGTTIDYKTQFEKSGYEFQNPNATKTCGCGSSFSV
ncbi:MAG: iron-sulfur cluster assembly accessory protein [Planctomycetes bacterium]|nr:iron-sulfur cluster assembly accessory protein [Planctomycetota bacterium]